MNRDYAGGQRTVSPVSMGTFPAPEFAMATPCGYCVRCESSLARLCFDTARGRWYVHCFECGGEREIENPCDYRWPGHLPVFLPPGSVAHWRAAIGTRRGPPALVRGAGSPPRPEVG